MDMILYKYYFEIPTVNKKNIMKTTHRFFYAFLLIPAFMVLFQETAMCQETEHDTLRVAKARVDTVIIEKVRVDTVVIEKVRVDTVRIETVKVEPKQEPVQKPKENPQNVKGKNEKVYYGGYANFSFGKYNVIGFEPLIEFKLLKRFSVGTKLSYEYFKDKRYETVKESSNYGASIFARLRIAKRLYGHIEYAGMNYKIYDSSGAGDRQWIPFLYLGAGYSLPISKTASLNAEVLWDLIQNGDSPYKTVQPFFSVGLGVGF